MSNNLSVIQSQYQVQNAELTADQATASRYPNLNASTSAGYQFGRSIDPTTNGFESQQIGYNSYSLSSGVLLYGGNRINNSIKQSKIDMNAAQMDADAVALDVTFQVATAYLNILLAEEQLRTVEAQLRLSQTQLEQTEKLIQAGSLPENDRLDFQSRIAQDEQNLINAQNQVNTNYLALKQLLQLEPEAELNIIRPEIDIPAENLDALSLEEVYTRALQTQPRIKANDLRVNSADYGVQIAKAEFLPSLSAFGSLGSNVSSIAKDFANPDITNAQTVLQPARPVEINGIAAQVAFFEVQGVTFPDQSFGDQLNQNFNQQVGVSLNLPIYNRGVNKINAQRAEIQRLNSQIASQQARQTLKTNVQRALADAKTAKRSYAAAQRAAEAAQGAFDNAQRRYDLGAMNTLDYSTSRNALDIAKLSLIQAKYQYIFNLKLLDLYLGKPVRLD